MRHGARDVEEVPRAGADAVLEALAEEQDHLAGDHLGGRLVVVVLMGARAGARRKARQLQAQARAPALVAEIPART